MEELQSGLKMSRIVKKGAVRVTEETMKFGQKIMSEHSGEAQVRLIQKGDTVEAIEVICPCGNKIEILCQYD